MANLTGVPVRAEVVADEQTETRETATLGA